MAYGGIANGVKHLSHEHRHGGPGALQTYVLSRGGDEFSWDHFAQLDDGTRVTAYEGAPGGLWEWRQILEANGLPLPHGWVDRKRRETVVLLTPNSAPWSRYIGW